MIKHLKLIIFILFCLLLAGYSYFIEPNRLEVNRYIVQDSQLKGIKIVFASDFHVKPYGQKRLDMIVEKINAENPDIVVSAGDFVCGHTHHSTMPIEQIAKTLGKVKAKFGFYTVLGNHDWWIDGEGITDTLTSNGIKVLANSNTKVNINGKYIYIAGVEDKTTRTPEIYSALENAKKPVILLTHSPDVFSKIPSNINLTLSGHVHGGQVRLPLLGALIVPSDYGDKYSLGLIEEKGKKMIVTKGIGNSILNVRFNCVPEIVVVEFE